MISGKHALVLVLVVLAAVFIAISPSMENHPVSFTLCSATTDSTGEMTAVTSAGTFVVTKPGLIARLGGAEPRVGQQFEGEYDGDPKELKKVSFAANPDAVLTCGSTLR